MNDSTIDRTDRTRFNVGKANERNALIDVEGVMRPALNRDGRRIHLTDEGVRNFWRGFDGVQSAGLGAAAKTSEDAGGIYSAGHGTARGLDASGRPRVFYHGTAAAINAFDLEHPERKDSGWLGRGVYLTTEPELVESYANIKGGYNDQTLMLQSGDKRYSQHPPKVVTENKFLG